MILLMKRGTVGTDQDKLPLETLQKNGKQRKGHVIMGKSGFAHLGEVQTKLVCFESGQIDEVHQKQESSQTPGL